jgi:adenylate cyclase
VKIQIIFFLQECPVTNSSALAAKVQFQGSFNGKADPDGLFRRTPLVFGFDPTLMLKHLSEDDIEFLNEDWIKGATLFPSLSLQTTLAYLDRFDRGTTPPRTQFSVELARDSKGMIYTQGLHLLRKDGSKKYIEMLPDGTIPLRFYGYQNQIPPPIPEFSLANLDVLFSSSFRKAYNLDEARPLSNHAVIIGPTSLGVYDLRPNPVDSSAPGVILHATATARLLEHVIEDRDHYSVEYASTQNALILLWSLGLLLALGTFYFKGLGSLWAFLVTVVTFGFFDFYLFYKNHLSVDSVTTFLCLLMSFVLVLAYNYFTEGKDRAFVKQAFEKYVSPDVVGSILADPKKLNLGGERKELSVLFSDVRGFTTISERMGAAELAKFMNDYLTPMTEIVQEERGTIDKYMGDAIMAIFGAPVSYENHASQAVRAGLRMLSRLEDLKPVWRAQGLPEIDIGVGVNTGEMSVGNMGSTRIFSYTVMGDAVNLGSRLEGITKEYAVRFIVSEFTQKQLNENFVCREIDRVRVKGKELPVTIFEVVGFRDTPGMPEKLVVIEKFEKALQAYYNQEFEIAEEIFRSLEGQDKTSAIYVERCASWREAPPSVDWDGSWTMKTK